MAVVVTENFTDDTNNAAESFTGWTSSDTPDITTGFAREGTNCMGMQGGTSNEYSYLDINSTDFSGGRTVFGWMINGGPGSTAQVGFGLVLGDGTNTRSYAVGGNDNYGHFVNGWSGFRLDSLILPATTRDIVGTAGPTLSTITEIGYDVRFELSALGKVNNIFYDIIRHIANGAAALTIAGGTTGARGTFSEITADDESTATGKGYGVIRRLTPGSKAYELTFGIEFGAATGDTFFSDNNFQLIIVGTNMSAGNLDVDLIAGTGTNLFILEDSVIVGVDTVSNWDMSAAFETMQFNRMSCTDLGTITFPASGGTLRQAHDCVFNNCGQLSIGTGFDFARASFNGTTDATGALLFDNAGDEANVSDLVFNSDGTGHAIYITATGTYDFDNYSFSGYSTASPGTNSTPSSGSTDAVIYNNSGGAVTINITGGSGAITVRNGASSTTTVVAGTVTTTIIVKDGSVSPPATITDSSVNVLVEASSGGSLTEGTDIIKGFVNTLGVISDTRSLASDQPIKGWARRASSGNTPLTSGFNLFKTAPIAGTINSTTGIEITVLLQPDE